MSSLISLSWNHYRPNNGISKSSTYLFYSYDLLTFI
uniref:Uncharacterized protein n=1 Tax=Podoviridae sp. ct2m58 TaxID=2827721 RepID=A0A8S5TLZ5_9CAUD|nr:MAG TPA: hypothetical protein [Podoviridae sp. ct2m58]